MIYLDTHAFSWLAEGNLRRFPGRVSRLLDLEDLCVSPAVILEFQFLYEIGRTTAPGQRVFDDLKLRIDLRLSENPFAAVVASATSLGWTRDPFDRLIVADASIERARLVTKDRHIHEHYARAVWD